MKKKATVLASILIFICNGLIIRAQDTLVAFDTMRIVEANYNKYDFSIKDTIIDTLFINISEVAQLSDVHFKFVPGLIGEMVTSATGLSLSGSQGTDFYLASTLKTNNPNLDWRFDIYTPGYVQKHRERVKNYDGSVSVNTSYSNVFDWNKGSIGYIIEDKDTIGWGSVHMQPRMDSIQQEWSKLVYKGISQPKWYGTEFVLKGEFTGKEIEIANNMYDERIYIIKQDTLMGIYQLQKPPKMTILKKNRIFYQPYLLVNNKLTEWERMDILRLSMVGIRTRRAVLYEF